MAALSSWWRWEKKHLCIGQYGFSTNYRWFIDNKQTWTWIKI